MKPVSHLALPFALTLAAPLAAQTQEDKQLWLNVTANVPVAGRLMSWSEVQPRFGEDVGQLSQLIVRPGLGWKASDRVTLWAGYAYILSEPADGGADSVEQRAWQQLSWGVGTFAGGALSSRTRLEQRFQEGGADTGWRLRQMLRYQAPIRPDSGVLAIVTVEPFFHLNDADWGPRKGFDQIRTFLGAGLPVTREVMVEAGYLNQYVDQPAGRARMNHVASLSLMLRY